MQGLLVPFHCTQRERAVSREKMVLSRMLSCESFHSRVNILQRYSNECSNDAQRMLTSSICRYCVQSRTGRQDEMSLMVTGTGKCLHALVGRSVQQEHSIDSGELWT